LTLEFTEKVMGNESPVGTPLMESISRWVHRTDPDANVVPVLLPGCTDSTWFRDAFPDCVAYGFFPMSHTSLFESAPLIHSANERIDIRDLGLAAGFYADLARDLLT
jgi:acetylornithine deacetylase/succinyl-diaminopimelate desuccinylase-like protein